MVATERSFRSHTALSSTKRAAAASALVSATQMKLLNTSRRSAETRTVNSSAGLVTKNATRLRTCPVVGPPTPKRPAR